MTLYRPGVIRSRGRCESLDASLRPAMLAARARGLCPCKRSISHQEGTSRKDLAMTLAAGGPPTQRAPAAAYAAAGLSLGRHRDCPAPAERPAAGTIRAWMTTDRRNTSCTTPGRATRGKVGTSVSSVSHACAHRSTGSARHRCSRARHVTTYQAGRRAVIKSSSHRSAAWLSWLRLGDQSARLYVSACRTKRCVGDRSGIPKTRCGREAGSWTPLSPGC